MSRGSVQRRDWGRAPASPRSLWIGNPGWEKGCWHCAPPQQHSELFRPSATAVASVKKPQKNLRRRKKSPSDAARTENRSLELPGPCSLGGRWHPFPARAGRQRAPGSAALRASRAPTTAPANCSAADGKLPLHGQLANRHGSLSNRLKPSKLIR